MNSCSSFQDYFPNDTMWNSKNSFQELLQPLILPAQVSEETLAKIITACILRKAYLVPSAWSKWILLAALEELLGNSTPSLDERQLNELQGRLINPTISSSGFDENLLEVSPLGSSAGNSCASTKTLKYVSEGAHSQSKHFKCSTIDIISSTPKDKLLHISYNNATPSTPLLVDKSVETEHFISKNVSTQCKHGTINSTHVQTDTLNEIARVDASTQKDLVLICPKKTNDFCSQIDIPSTTIKKDFCSQIDIPSTTIIKPSKSITSQTDFIHTTDAVCQTSPSWKFIKISGIDYSQKTNRSVTSILDNGQIIKLFYGRPLLGSRSKLPATTIPLQPVSHFSSFDPRISNMNFSELDYPSDHFGKSDTSDLSEAASSFSVTQRNGNEFLSSTTSYADVAMETDESF